MRPMFGAFKRGDAALADIVTLLSCLITPAFLFPSQYIHFPISSTYAQGQRGMP